MKLVTQGLSKFAYDVKTVTSVVTLVVFMTTLTFIWNVGLIKHDGDYTHTHITEKESTADRGVQMYEERSQTQPHRVTSSTDERSSRVQKVCQHYTKTCGEAPARRYKQILVDDLHRVLYCYVPKVACTTLKAVLLEARAPALYRANAQRVHSENLHREAGLSYLSDYDPQQRRIILDTYYKFVAVRHPFDRLVSAFKDKFEMGNYSHLFYEDSITFQKFLEMIPNRYRYNIHWGRYNDSCDVCCIKYDHIIKLETLNADMLPVLKHLGDAQGNKYVIPSRNNHRNISDHLLETKKIFSDIPRTIIDNITEWYRMDMELFGYTWE